MTQENLYNGNGHRIRKSEADDTTRGTGTAEAYYLYTKDIGESTTNIIDDTGAGVVSYQYDDYGETETFGDTTFFNEICYTGGIHDASTGIYYLNARYYDPASGVFLSQDSYRGELNDPASLNLYGYCQGNPVTYTDPTGHFPWLVAATWLYRGYKTYKAVKTTAKVVKAVKTVSKVKNTYKAVKSTKKIVRAAKKVKSSKKIKKLFKKSNTKRIANKVTKKLKKKSTFKKKETLNKSISERKNVKFSKKAEVHMEEKGRHVPMQILKAAIKNNKAYPDPRGSNAKMYYTTMYKNKKKYNLEVLYDEGKNMIMHFKYTSNMLL